MLRLLKKKQQNLKQGPSQACEAPPADLLQAAARNKSFKIQGTAAQLALKLGQGVSHTGSFSTSMDPVTTTKALCNLTSATTSLCCCLCSRSILHYGSSSACIMSAAYSLPTCARATDQSRGHYRQKFSFLRGLQMLRPC
eukprot:1157488-Pelagomonas_calceolata.AAC.3